MSRIDDLLTITPQVKERPRAIEAPASLGDIDYQNVSFGYSHGQPILQGVSLSIPAGTSAAFVGASGSGKSTNAESVAAPLRSGFRFDFGRGTGYSRVLAWLRGGAGWDLSFRRACCLICP